MDLAIPQLQSLQWLLITFIIKSKLFPVASQAPHHLICDHVHFNTPSSLFTLWPSQGLSSQLPAQGLYHPNHSFLQSVAAPLLLLIKSQLKCHIHGASLVAQWLRICLPMQGTRVRALVWEDPTCRGATGPVSHNY